MLRLIRHRQQHHGMSLIEIMVGIAVGMLVLAGGTKLIVDSLTTNRRLLVETRLNQDLRVAADLVARDLRRAGYWRRAERGVWYKGGPTLVTSNPYASSASAVSPTWAEYAYSKDADAALNVATEVFGFKLEDSTLKARVNNEWRPLTDPETTLVTAFAVNFAAQPPIDLSAYCHPVGCSLTLGCPVQRIRGFEITLTARAKSDAAVTRTIREEVRIRNDQVSGACAG